MSCPRSSDRPRRPAGRRPLAALLSSAAVVAGLLAVATPAQAATFTVNSAADTDDGTCDATDCTLREAINAANGAAGEDSISFAIGSGPVTISVAADLPAVTSPVFIDGRTQPGYVDTPLVELDGENVADTGLDLTVGNNYVFGLTINRFSSQQILVESQNNGISQNYLGTNAAGTARLAGGSFGTLRIRGAGRPAYAGVNNNVIAGDVAGVVIEASNGGSASGSRVSQNRIGVGADGGSLGSGGPGILVSTTGGGVATGNYFDDNMIAFNGGLGIDLGGDGRDQNDPNDADGGPNYQQNYPVLTGASTANDRVTVSGTLNSIPNTNFRVEFFANQACDPSGFGEGQAPLSFIDVTTDSTGNASFSPTFASPGATYDVVTATATNFDEPPSAGFETSEFSACQQVTPAQATQPSPPTGVTAGAGDGQAEVSWQPPAADGGSPIVYYNVYPNPNPNEAPVTVAGDVTSVTISGLDNGTTYTFTVVAVNEAGKTSDPSAPSNAVTPAQGAAPPETVSTDAAPNGTVSTGTTASSGDPTNTTIITPNGGTVTIGEGAMTGTPPPGVEYVGQQIDITAPDATANDPMTFTFITDCSVLPSNVSTCSSTPKAGVSVTDGAYQPPTATVDQGGKVTWHFDGQRRHSVTDSLGLGPDGAPLFSSGSRAPGATYSHTFKAAGTYPYHSTVAADPAGMSGVIDVPVQVSAAAASPSTPVVVTWASSKLSGYRFDVQYRYRTPGGASYGPWRSWRTDTTRRSGRMVATNMQGEGDYQFRSRLENIGTGQDSGWSSPGTVTATSARRLLDSVAMFHQNDQGVNAQVPDCTGPYGVAQPAPTCTWSEEILPDGDLRVVIFTTRNGRWRTGII